MAFSLGQPHTAVRRRITGQMTRMHPSGSIESDKVTHRRWNELPAARHRHIHIRITHQRPAARVDDLAIDVRKMIHLFFNYLEIPGLGQMSVTAARNRRR